MTLEDLHEQVVELREECQETRTAVAGMSPRVERIDRELFGNGRPGLVVSMAKMQQQMKVGIWLTTTIGGASLTALVGIFVKVVLS